MHHVPLFLFCNIFTICRYFFAINEIAVLLLNSIFFSFNVALGVLSQLLRAENQKSSRILL